MATSNKQIIIVDAIISEIELGKAYAPTCAVICGRFRFSDRTFDKYWKIANEQHLSKQQALKKEILKVDKQAAVKARKKAIMTAEERKVYLTKLIKGEVKIPYTEVKWNAKTLKFQKIKFVELANPVARIQAIAELNKMEGDYMPSKLAFTDPSGKSITGLKFGYGEEVPVTWRPPYLTPGYLTRCTGI